MYHHLTEICYWKINNLNVDIIEADLVKIVKRYVKHNANALAKIIMEKILKM